MCVKLVIVAWWTRTRSRWQRREGDQVLPGAPDVVGVAVDLAAPTVVIALPLKPEARRKLAALLGNVNVVDICEREAFSSYTNPIDVVTAPVCSPQMIGRLKAMFPEARIIVVELEDWEFGIDAGGPVTRLRNAGADAYLAAGSLQKLADQLTSRRSEEPVAPTLAAQAVATEFSRELSAASVDDLVLERLLQAEAMRQEQQTATRHPL
jgi:hypothetical protein